MPSPFRSGKVWLNDEQYLSIKLSSVYAPGTAPFRWAMASVLAGLTVAVVIVTTSLF